MLRVLLLLLLTLTACRPSGQDCDPPLLQTCRNNAVMTCGTDRTWFETDNCNAVLPRERDWVCCDGQGPRGNAYACIPRSLCHSDAGSR